MYDIPTSITVNDTEYCITNKGDYRVIIACLEALDDTNLTKQERLFASLIIFYEDINSIMDIVYLDNDVLESLIKEMFAFINCGQTESPGAKTNYKLINWEQDSQLICSAINKVANFEIRAIPYLHWWTFMGYYLAVGESALSTVVGIRHKMVTGKKLEKYENTFVQDNPQYFNVDLSSTEQRELDELANLLWKESR